MPLAVGLTMVCLFVVLLILADMMLIARTRVREDEIALSAAQRLGDAAYADLNQLDRTAQMWAARGDTYRFMESRDASEIDVDLADAALANLGVNFMLFLDVQGQPLRAQFMDLDLEVAAEPDAAVIRTVQTTRGLMLSNDPHGTTRGFIRLPDGVAMVAARPITTGDLYGAPHGTLVVGRYLNQWSLDKLSALVQMPVELVSAEPDDRARLTTDSSSAPDTSGVVWWAPVDDDTLAAHALLVDLSGQPLGSLKAELPRDAVVQGRASMGYTGISLLLIGITATVVVFLLLDRMVLGRLARLSAQREGIRESGDITGRVVVGGSDELASLAGDVNAMLASLEGAEQQLEAANEDLEVRVADRTSELALSESRYRSLLNRMADAVFCVNLEGRITLVNDCGADIVGSTRAELVGLRFADLIGNVSMDDVQVRATDASDRDGVWTIEVPFGRAGHDTVPVELRGTALVDDAGGVVGTQWIVRDMTERKKFEQQLLHMASHDHLTGLRNRRSFEQALELRLAEMRRGKGRGAIVWLDLDDFKEVNDTLGHRAGDEVLVMLAEQLNKQVRESNMLARLGGDEFAILLAEVTEEEAETAAARILSAINSFTYVLEGRSIRLSASVGVVTYPGHGTTVEELLANADLAMYHAKDSGRSRVHVHQVDEVWRQDIKARVSWNQRITDALENNRFVLFGQPLLDLRSQKTASYELLIRMRDDSDELIMPAEFLPTAERLGLIHDIDHWVILEAVRLLAANPDMEAGLDVNLSGKAFADPNLLPTIATALENAHVDPHRLGFEITETAAIADVTRAQELISSLKELGCRFSLDDFGSGFSSFYYLKHLAIDCLKVDGSFIKALPHSRQDQHLVRGMVEMCRGLEIEVVAEYVEDAEILMAVTDLEIDYAQGYHISRPAPMAQVLGEEADS